MKRIFPELSIADDNWHELPAAFIQGARVHNLVLYDTNGVEQLDVAVSTDSGATWGETMRTMPGIPFCIPGQIEVQDRVRVKRVSANAITIQAGVEYDAH